jgi:hypothetical protein
MYMYDMNVGYTLKWFTVSTLVWWNHLHSFITYDISQLSKIWGSICGGKIVRVHHPQLQKVQNHLVLYDMDVKHTLKWFTVSSVW